MRDVPRRQFAAGYRHPAFFWVDTWSGYSSSAFDPKGVQQRLAPDGSDADLGRAVLDALARSHFFSDEEMDTTEFFHFEYRNRVYDTWVAQLMAANRLKTKRALFKDLDYVEITLQDGIITFAPKHHVKLEAWKEVAGVADVTVPASRPPEEIGAGLRQAFALCTKK